MATKHKVRESIEINPDWTARQHADAIGCSPQYVRSTAIANGWKLGRRPETVPALVLHALSREMFHLLEGVAKGRSALRDQAREIIIRAKGGVIDDVQGGR